MRKTNGKWAGVLAAGITAVGFVTSGVAQASPARMELRPAHAQPADCAHPAYGPSTVNVGLSSGVTTFAVIADCTGGLTDWSLDTSLFFVYKDAPDNTFHPYELTDSDAGNHDITLTTDDANYTEDQFVGTFTLKRYDTWGNTFNAYPEPVKKGSPIKFTGQLLRVNWDQGKYYGYGNGYTQLQFRAQNTPTWHTVKTLRTSTSSPGLIDGTSIAATTSGFWRVYYTGNEFGSPAYSKTDYVEVT